MTNDRWRDLREWLGIACFVLVGGAFLYVSDWPRVRPWAGGVWMLLAVSMWSGIRRLVAAKAGWFKISYAAGMGTALALYALCYWLNADWLKEVGVYLIIAFVGADWWRQHRPRLDPSRETLIF